VGPFAPIVLREQRRERRRFDRRKLHGGHQFVERRRKLDGRERIVAEDGWKVDRERRRLDGRDLNGWRGWDGPRCRRTR
jgi:hypothetical protein